MNKKNNILKYKKVLTIVSVYDIDGIVDNYLIYYLSSLKSVSSRIIIVVNGILTDKGKKRLNSITNEIYIRKNQGFDFGAYRDVIQNYLQKDELDKYQELILCNDTCFGPFVPFKNIFLQMEREDLKFWSINYIDDLLLPHFQSYFMVFRKEAIRLVLNFLEKEVDDKVTYMPYAHGYEHALSELILKSDISTDFYTSKMESSYDIDIFGAPDYAIKYLEFPFLKRKVFSESLYHRENCLEALRLIKENFKYPLPYILENVNRIYHKDFGNKIEGPYSTNIYTFQKNYTSREEVIAFCEKYEKIYLYGNGYLSVLFMARFRRYMKEFGGYIVSDEYYKENLYKKEQIYPLSYIEENVPIIVTLMKDSSLEVVDKVRRRKNILFLSIKQEDIFES